MTRYLLNLSHPDGASKAKFFMRRGFSLEEPEVLKNSLLDHAGKSEVVEEQPNPFGTKYVLHGSLICPNGTTASVRTVWIIENDTDFPQLVTAYPL